jgi:NAD(P)H-nitrite reductase large subunit
MGMQVVIVGSGIAGITCAEELLKRKPDAAVHILTQETLGYYSRPLLSNGFTRDNIESTIILRSFEALEKAGIAIEAGANVTHLDPHARTVAYHKGGAEFVLPYDGLVLALGSAALIPPPFTSQQALFHVLNSLTDLIALRRRRAEIKQAGHIPRWAIVGGGLIGCEAASDLVKAGDQVTLFHALPRLMERQLVQEDSATLLAVLKNSGVDVILDCAVQGFQKQNGHLSVLTGQRSYADFHTILVACGFKPRISLAQAAGLAVQRGILVDDFLVTSNSAIFAAGDVAEFANGKLYAYVTPVRSQGLWLGQYLAGETNPPWQPPFFKPKAKVHGFTAAHPYLF